ncbi:MAG: RHS repeat-associated core domain-containing protein [Pseudomonadota bacterium]|uniref:RHS repeat-associated core domain-containing protein n=1 Tax=Blastomonas sp. TaxID=1909299 RepID=UPI00182F8A4A|nr:RHS repeat protein [Blastomonas sp.]
MALLLPASPISAQASLPGSAPPTLPAPTWRTIISGGSVEFYLTPDLACRRQHQSFNPNATYEPPEYQSPTVYGCKWKARQFGGPPNSTTVLPSFVSMACPAGFVWTRTAQCVQPLDNEPECPCPDPSKAKALGPAAERGNPVSLVTGAKVERAQDYTTADGRFSVERHYRSRQHQAQRYAPMPIPGFGPNWHGVVPGRLAAYGNYTEMIEYLSESGGVDYFQVPGPSNTTSWNYVTPGGGRRRLTAVSIPTVSRTTFFRNQAAVLNGPAEFKLTEADGSYTLYRRSANWSSADEVRYLVPIQQVSPDGFSRTFEYDDTSQYPSRVRDSFGREMQLSWTETKLKGFHAPTNAFSVYGGGLSWKVISQIDLPDGTKLVYTYSDTTTATRSGREDRLIRVSRRDAVGTELWARAYLYENAALPYALTGQVDQNGARLSTYTYHPSGLVQSTERAGGFDKIQLQHSFVAPGTTPQAITNYRAVTNPLGRVEAYAFWRLSYFAPGNMPAVIDWVDGYATATVPADSIDYGYQAPTYDNSVRLLSSVTDPRGVRTNYTNDQNNRRPTAIVEAASTASARTTNIQWHPVFDLPVQIDIPGLRTQMTYNATGQLLSRKLTDTTTHTLPYATSGQARTESYSWSAQGRLLSVNGPRPVNQAGQDDVTTFAYDAIGNLVTMTNPLGHVTSYAGHDANGRPASITDPNGTVTELVYDPLGRLLETRVKDPAGLAPDAVTALEYDVEGRVVGVTLPQTLKLTMGYNLAGLLTAITAPNGESIAFNHDAMGNVTQRQVRRADGSPSSTIASAFDSLGRMLSLTLGPSRTTSWTYDKNGNATQMVSPRNHPLAASFDPLNRLVSTLAPDAGTTSTTYNSRDEVTAFTDPAVVTTGFVRNGFGEVIRETSPDRGTSIYYYDAAGDIVATIDGRGQRIDYLRDILGRVVSATPQGLAAQATTYIYDSAALPGSASLGQLSSVTTGSVDVRFAYDHRGNATMKQQRIGGGEWLILALNYDLADRITEVTYPSGRSVAYAYDPLGRVETVRTREAAAAGWTDLAANIVYEPFAAIKSADLGSGLKLSVDWGNDQRLAGRRVYRSNGTDIWHASYAYDANDNITAITDLVNPGNSRSYGYDSMDRLVRTDGVLGSYGREDYVHDRNGNRLAIQRRVNAGDATPADTESYALASGTNQLASVTGASGTRSFTHDARGNLTGDARSSGPNVTVSYDGHARLVGYANGAGDAQVMAYNGLDERVQLVTTPAGGAADTRMVFYDLDHRIIGEYGAGGASDLKAEYIWLLPQVGADGPFGGDDGTGGYMPLAIAIGAGGGTSQIAWTHGNHLGTPVLTTDATGTALAPYGHALIGFPGQWRPANAIAGADFYYNRYRDYDPTLGRYIQADPIGLAGDVNPYGYVGGNPVSQIDPEGLFGKEIAGLLLFGGGNLAYQLYQNGGRVECINWWEAGEWALTGATLGFGWQWKASWVKLTPGSMKWGNASRRIRRAENLVGKDIDLHHWALPRRWGDGRGGWRDGIVNHPWNLNPVPRGAHQALHQRGALGALVRGSPTPVRGGVVTAIGAMGVNQIGGYDE